MRWPDAHIQTLPPKLLTNIETGPGSATVPPEQAKRPFKSLICYGKLNDSCEPFGRNCLAFRRCVKFSRAGEQILLLTPLGYVLLY